MQTPERTGAGDGLMKSIGDVRNDMYQRLNNAVAERGYVNDHSMSFVVSTTKCRKREMLGDVEQRLDSLQQSSKDMVTQVNYWF